MLFLRGKGNKPTIVAIHGFGTRGINEFDNLKKVLDKKGYTFKAINLYDLQDENDADWATWVSRARSLITDVAHDSNIVLIGFSMGGVIASYLANEYKVKKLVLLAPAFEFISLTNLFDYMPKPFVKSGTSKSKMPTNFTNTFMEIINNCKNSISDIKVPTLIIHCEEDNVIPISSSQKNIKKIPTKNKILLALNGGQHRILDDKIVGPIAISNIICFIEDEFLK